MMWTEVCIIRFFVCIKFFRVENPIYHPYLAVFKIKLIILIFFRENRDFSQIYIIGRYFRRKEYAYCYQSSTPTNHCA